VTRTTSARVAGAAYLLYIALAFPAMTLYDRATAVPGVAAKLARIADHATDMRAAAVLTLLTAFVALTLAVALYRITRDEDRELAMLAMACRVAEGVLNASAPIGTLGLLWLATAAGPSAPDPAAAQALGAYLLKVGDWSTIVGATLFAVGSTLFSWLLLRGRMIPVVLAWVGVIASVLLVVGLPLQLAGLLRGAITQLMWLPMAAFEIPLGLWWLVKGDTAPATRSETARRSAA
jgi:Domain of unknown function (DUF4386)